MFSKILGKKENSATQKQGASTELTQRILSMNLTEMRAYINNKIPDLEVSEEGLIGFLKKLVYPDKKTSKRYIEIDDMQSKVKKGLDLIVSIAKHKKITVVAIELIQEYIQVSEDIIQKYDQEHKEIYGSRLKDALGNAVNVVNARSNLKTKMDVLQ